MERVQTAGEARLARCLLPAFLCVHIFIERETSGYEGVFSLYLGETVVDILVFVLFGVFSINLLYYFIW